MNQTEVLVIGGGLAGLVASNELRLAGREVLLVEKKRYPFHRVCGEYISRETLPLLNRLGLDPFALGAQTLDRFQFTSPRGKMAEIALPLGAFSLSRFTLDEALYQRFLLHGGTALLETSVRAISHYPDYAEVELSNGEVWQTKILIGAYGKRSALDRTLGRTFFFRRSPYLGIKYHAELDFPTDLVSLHNFRAGYCGVSCIEGDQRVNICYLTTRDQLRRYKSIDQMTESVLCANPRLRQVLEAAVPLFPQPLVINEISFAPRECVVEHMLMAGDAAGMIMPLSGNGMAMAMQGAYLVAGWVAGFLDGRYSRNQMEQGYTRDWESTFRGRLWSSRQIEKIFRATFWSELSVPFLHLLPGLGKSIIKKTHGQEFGYTPYVASA